MSDSTQLSTRTKIAIGLGLIDIARKLAQAYSAHERAQREQAAWGAGFRADASRWAHDVRDRLPDHPMDKVLPWRHTPTRMERARPWLAVAATAAAASAAVILTARHVARVEETRDDEEIANDSRVRAAVSTGSQAIDAGVSKVVEGASAGASTAASAVAAGGSVIHEVTVQRAKDEIDVHVVKPAKRKAVVYGTIAVAGLTTYVIAIAVIVQLVVAAIG